MGSDMKMPDIPSLRQPNTNKLCIKCVHCDSTKIRLDQIKNRYATVSTCHSHNYVFRCQRKILETNLVTGAKTYVGCKREREATGLLRCGPEGQYFEDNANVIAQAQDEYRKIDEEIERERNQMFEEERKSRWWAW